MNAYQVSSQEGRKKPKLETTQGYCWNGLMLLASNNGVGESGQWN